MGSIPAPGIGATCQKKHATWQLNPGITGIEPAC